MSLLVMIFIGCIAVLHFYFLYLEMFAWTTKAPKVFRGFTKEFFTKTKAMAANQGLYNGFLAIGLVWTFFIQDSEWWFKIAFFFLSCVFVAGCYGAMSVSKKIFVIQGLPALIALSLILLNRVL